MPGRFDQQPPRVPGSRFRDRAKPALLPGRCLGRDQTDVAHQLLGAGEPLEVADLGAQPDRCQRVNPAQAPQPADLHDPRRARQHRDDLALALLATVHVSLCTIPDDRAAVREVRRVLRRGGRFILMEHVRSPIRPVRAGQRVLEPLFLRLEHDHLTRDPLDYLEAEGFEVEAVARLTWGIAVARKPIAAR
jgi:SAM-dependent methyltransferase